MGTRDLAAGVDFSGVLEQEVEDALKAAAQISMGTEISQEDLDNILALCDQVGQEEPASNTVISAAYIDCLWHCYYTQAFLSITSNILIALPCQQSLLFT